MNRPAGVSVISVLLLLASVYYIVSGVVGMGLAGVGSVVMATLPFGFMGGLLNLIIGLGFLGLGWGMWNMQSWARLLTLIWVLLGLLAGIVTMVQSGLGLGLIMGLLIDVIILLYLFNADVKSAFGSS